MGAWIQHDITRKDTGHAVLWWSGGKYFVQRYLEESSQPQSSYVMNLVQMIRMVTTEACEVKVVLYRLRHTIQYC